MIYALIYIMKHCACRLRLLRSPSKPGLLESHGLHFGQDEAKVRINNKVRIKYLNLNEKYKVDARPR